MTCWEQADKKIKHYAEQLALALKGEGKAHPDICRDMIDKWLDYRLSHSPDDVVNTL